MPGSFIVILDLSLRVVNQSIHLGNQFFILIVLFVLHPKEEFLIGGFEFEEVYAAGRAFFNGNHFSFIREDD
jgi:hypothetical protein